MKPRYWIAAAVIAFSVLMASMPCVTGIASGADAPAPSPSDIVYVTATGKRYHTQDCRYAKNATAMTRGEAEEKGLTPCKVCKP